jgi:hypothetical protein
VATENDATASADHSAANSVRNNTLTAAVAAVADTDFIINRM